MCEEYQTTSIVGGLTKTETIQKECPEKPAGGSIKQCSRYKFNAAGSSRQKRSIPSWAKGGDKGDKADKADGASSASAK